MFRFRRSLDGRALREYGLGTSPRLVTNCGSAGLGGQCCCCTRSMPRQHRGLLYLLLGGMNDTANGMSSAYAYTPSSTAWSAVSSMTTGRAQLGAARARCIGDTTKSCLYAIGGVDSSGQFLDSVEIYDPSTNTWSSGPPLPTPNAPANYPGRAQLAAGTGPCFGRLSQTCVYVAGGYNAALYALSSVEMLNPATGAWTAAAPLNVGRSRLAMASVPCRGKPTLTCLYAIGGTGPDGFVDSVEMYNPAKNAWTEEAVLHVRGSSASLGVAGMAAAGAPCITNPSRRCLYAFGGQDQNFNILNTVMMYDPTTDSWTYRAGMKQPRDNFGGDDGPCPGNMVQDCLYAVAGSGRTYLQVAEAFNPSI